MKATREQTKTHNSRLILKTIYREGEISRADIARRTGLTRTTVSTLTDELVQSRLIQEGDFGPSMGGKPPLLLSVNENARVVICLDLSEELFRGAIVNLHGRILYSTGQEQNEQELDGRERVLRLARRLVAHAGQAGLPVLGIGVGSQGVIDVNTGIVLHAVRLGWQNVPLRQVLTEAFQIPVYLLNDSDAAALGEYAFGRHRSLASLVMIHAGEGISAGILLNGHLFHGDGFGAGEISHTRAVPGGKLCHCGHTGCLQTVASSIALLNSACEIYPTRPDSILHHLAADPAALTLADIVTAAGQGDAATLEIVRAAGIHLGHAAAYITGLLNVRYIYITGPLAAFGNALLDPIRQTMMDDCLETLARETHVSLSSHPEHLVPLGAAAAVLRDRLGII